MRDNIASPTLAVDFSDVVSKTSGQILLVYSHKVRAGQVPQGPVRTNSAEKLKSDRMAHYLFQGEPLNLKGRGMPSIEFANGARKGSNEANAPAYSLVCHLCTRVFVSGHALGVHQRRSHAEAYRAGALAAELRLPPGPPRVNCTLCEKSFCNSRGLTLHTAKKHNEEISKKFGKGVASQDDAGEIRKTGTRWSDEELAACCKIEVALEGVPGPINRLMMEWLREKGYHRTVVAIESQRRTPRYRTLLEVHRGRDREKRLRAEAKAQEAVAVSEEPAEREENANDLPQTGESPTVGESSLDDADPALADKVDVWTFLTELMETETETEHEDFFENELDEIINGLLLDSEKSVDLVDAQMESYFRHWRPKSNAEKGPKQFGPHPKMTKCRKRVLEHKRISARYKANRKRCAHEILAGGLEGGLKPAEIDGFAEYWTKNPLWRSQPVDVSDMEHSGRQTYSEIWTPIPEKEVTSILTTMDSNSAAGPDEVTVRSLKDMPKRILVKVLNMFLLAGRMPACLKVSRTVFIKKGNAPPKTPKDYRPISLQPTIVRLFNKILAKRLLKYVDFDFRQRAFHPVDGCAENVMLLETILTEARKRCKSVYVANLDISNAYPSVYHSAIIKALECSGAPSSFVEYVRDLYRGFVTEIKIGDTTYTVPIQKGVLQGDPLSPALFNLVIDQGLKGIDEDVGFRLTADEVASGMAFADDMNLVASTKGGLQSSLNGVSRRLQKWGLLFNASKCNYLAIEAEKGRKVSVSRECQFVIDGQNVKPADEDTPWRYLGAYFDSRGLKDAPFLLPTWLERVKKCRLKPQQKLYILKEHVLPKLKFRLTFAPLTKMKLEKVDRTIRAFLTGRRGILRLPVQTPLEFFYTPVNMGGLGLVRFAHSIPVECHDRFERMIRSKSNVISTAARLTANTRRLTKAAKIMPESEELGKIDSRLKVRLYNADKLYESIDGRGLREASGVPFVHKWIADGTTYMRGDVFQRAVKMRINALPSRSRTARGKDLPRVCRAGCRVPETNFHVIQECIRSHPARMVRHNTACKSLGQELQRLGYEVQYERIFETAAGRRKPDLVARREGTTWVVDATVCNDARPVDARHNQKVQYYSASKEIAEELLAEGANECKFGALAVTFKGIVSVESWKCLEEMGIKKTALTKIVTDIVVGSVKCFSAFNSSTMPAGRRLVRDVY